MIRIRTIVAAGILASIATTVATAQQSKAPSVCKGLEQSACGATPACKWQAAITAGDVNPRTSKPYVASRKAHCRAGSKAKAS